jgi:hypothetical protein
MTLRMSPVALLLACGTPTDEPEDTTPTTVEVTEASFRCITDMTAVRGFYVDNLLGDLSGTVAAAEEPLNATWPVGSLVQLIPAEAMVKREAGFNTTTNDWEFFALRADAEGTTILKRGGEEVENPAGSCYGCHAAAADYDLICEDDHGCVPLGVNDATITLLQEADARCGG